MKYQRTIGLLALCAILSACDAPDTVMMNGHVTLKDNIVTLHADNAPDALINADGTLQIGDKVVPATPTQHGLLLLYFQHVADVRQTGLEMGKLGGGMGIKVLKDTFDGKSKADRQQDAEAGGKQMKELAHKICRDQASIKSVQDQLAVQLPAFKPYATIATQKDVEECTED